jgi:hypothetical protein
VSADRAVIEPFHRLPCPCPELVNIGAFGCSLHVLEMLVGKGRAHIFVFAIPIIHIKEFGAVLTIKGFNALGLGIPYDFFSWAKRVPR